MVFPSIKPLTGTCWISISCHFQTGSQANRHIPLRIDHLRADFLQNSALILTGGLGNHVGHAQGNHVQGGQDTGINTAADADDDGIAVLDSHL